MSNHEPAVIVKDLYKSFRLPHEQHSGLKQFILNFFRRPSKRVHGYETQHVLEDISFEIQKGEFFGIVGRNGSGKSTLLKLLAGIYTPDKGALQVNGTLTPFIELGVGFNPELTGRENVYLNGALLGFSHDEMDAMYDDIVEFAELEKFMDQKLKNYSSGMQVRLAFSIAIRAQTDILLLDEVLAVGDAAFQKKCYDYFRQLKRNKKTVIFISHDMNAIREYCDRTILIDNGKIIHRGEAEGIATEYIKLFLTTSSLVHSSDGKRWGNKAATIQNIDTSITSDKIAVNVSVKFNVESLDPIVGFYLNNPLGIKIIENNTKWLRKKTGSYKSGETAEIQWLFPNILTNGNNTVTIAVSNHDATEYYDWFEDALTIPIDKPEEITTACTLPKDTITIKRRSP